MQFFGFYSAMNCTSTDIRNRLQYTYREAINLLSNRQMRILHLLIEEQDYITIAELAERFNVSQRTIQYDLEGIEDQEDVLDFKIYRNKSEGMKIETSNGFLLKKDNSDALTEVHYTKDERVLNIELKLFESDVPISSRVLSELVNVSRRTIVDDLKVVQEYLEKFNLQLEYVKNKGFVIQGEEDAYRKAYAHCIKTYFQNAIPFAESSLFSESDLASVRQTVVQTLKDEDYHLVQSATDGLIYHVLIALQRLKEDYSFEIPKEEIKRLSDTPQYKIASKMKENLEQIFNIEFPQSEAIFITLHLLGSKTSNDDIPGNNSDIELYVLQLIEHVGAALGLDLTKDNKLLNGLLIHIKPAIHRLQFDMAQKNPLKEEIYHRYHSLIDAIKSNIRILERPLHISFTSDELAFIAIHFASSIERVSTKDNQPIKVVLLCGSGIGTSQLLKSKLANSYPELDIADAYSVYQINEKQLLNERVDYIISTVPFEIEQIPVIHVDPFLNKDSRMKLNNMINQAREKRIASMNEIGPDLRSLLPENRISTIPGQFKRDEAIELAVEPLIKDGIVTDGYSNEIKAQFEKFGAYMVISPHIALIHAGSEEVLSGAGFAITFFPQGVVFEHEHHDPVYLVITLATESPKFHLKALGQLSQLLMDSKSKEAFLKGKMDEMNLYINEVSTREV